jgi:hypothetical protein
MLDSSVLHEVNQVVEQRLGKGQGLKIAEVLRGKSADGMHCGYSVMADS